MDSAGALNGHHFLSFFITSSPLILNQKAAATAELEHEVVLTQCICTFNSPVCDPSARGGADLRAKKLAKKTPSFMQLNTHYPKLRGDETESG